MAGNETGHLEQATMGTERRYCLPEEWFQSSNVTRYLQSDSSTSDDEPLDDSSILADTLLVYGSIFVAAMLAFCLVRVRYPKTFNVRTWIEPLKCDLAEEAATFGFFSWFWKVRRASSREIREQCGMDAACLDRMFFFGMKIFSVGMFNSIWLFPIYATSVPEDEELDAIARLSIAYVPPGSNRLIATVLSTYIIFGFTMYFILQEFKWFAAHRHAYQSERKPRNYAMYIRGLPEYLRSDAALKKYFSLLFTDAVLDAHVALRIPALEAKVRKREALSRKLEHFINIEQMKGTTPMTKSITGKPSEEAIPVAVAELTQLNQEIAEEVTAMEELKLQQDILLEKELPLESALVNGTDESAIEESAIEESANEESANDESAKVAKTVGASQSDLLDESFEAPSETDEAGNDETATGAGNETDIEPAATEEEIAQDSGMADSSKKLADKLQESVSHISGSVTTSVQKGVTRGVLKSKKLACTAKKGALALVRGEEEGSPKDAGFVYFKNLSSKQAAVQGIHHSKPFYMDTCDAPDPENVFYRNVGKSSHELQTGKLLSIAMTAALRLTWTIPTAFISSLRNIESISQELPWLADWIDKEPWLATFCAILAPLLLVLLNSSLPTLLEWITLVEFPLSQAAQVAQQFPKLASFMIIQTFFVSAVSGGIWAEIENIVNDPSSIIDFLATSLPGQSTYFIQLLLVKTFIGLAIEMLRFLPLFKAALRRYHGPNLTKEESSRRLYGFLRPLCDPLWLLHAEVASANVLYTMVFFVYSSTAPLVNWFLMFCFGILYLCWRYEYFCNYPLKPDTGGRIWITFMGIVRAQTIIGQLTLLGLLGFKRKGWAIPLMLPLLIINALFNIYMEQRHKQVAEFLPTEECLKVDLKNRAESQDEYNFLVDHYLQPALKAKEDVYPDNYLPLTNESDDVEKGVEWKSEHVVEIGEDEGEKSEEENENEGVEDQAAVDEGVEDQAAVDADQEETGKGKLGWLFSFT